MLNTDQTVATYKANIESFFALSNSALEGVEKLAALNLKTSKAGLADAAALALDVLSVKDAAALGAMSQGLAQSASEKSTAYGREVHEIVSATSAVFGKAAEGLTADGQQQLAALVDSAIKNAPAGSEQALSLVKATVAAANDAIEGAQKAAKQAAEAAEANFASLSSSVMLPKAAPAKARRAA